jgi:hypothetical protein
VLSTIVRDLAIATGVTAWWAGAVLFIIKLVIVPLRSRYGKHITLCDTAALESAVTAAEGVVPHPVIAQVRAAAAEAQQANRQLLAYLEANWPEEAARVRRQQSGATAAAR